MHWNHRLIKYTLPDGEELYAVREVFYKEDGSLCGYVDDPDGVQGGSPREVSKYITWMRKALKMPVLTPADFGLTDEQALKKDWDSAAALDNAPAEADDTEHGLGDLADGGVDPAGVHADTEAGLPGVRGLAAGDPHADSLE